MSGLHDPDGVALRIQRLERVALKIFNETHNPKAKDIELARDVNAMSMDLQREGAQSPAPDVPF